MYSVGEFDGVLSTVNLTTGDTTPVGPSNGTFMTGLTFSLDFSTLYSFDSPGGPLLSVDPSDGSAVSIGPTGASLLDLATDGAGNVYGSGTGLSGAGLYSINVTTGAATSIGGTLGFTAIAFDESDTLYGVEFSSDALYTIDVSDGAASFVGGNIGEDVRGLAFTVPEPGISLLLATGVLGLGWVGRRRLH